MLNSTKTAFRRVQSTRALVMAGTALGAMLFPAFASAQNVTSVGNTDYTLIETGTRSGGPRTVDITTTGGNIVLDFGTINTTNNGPTIGAGIAATNTGPGNVTIGVDAVTATGTGTVYGIDARTAAGNIFIDSGTVNANNTVNSRGIQAISGGGNITIFADVTNGGQRAIFTGSNGGIFPNVVTIVSNVATASGLSSPNAIVAQGQTVNLTSGTARNTNTAGVSGTAIFVNAGTGGATVRANTTEALGNGQAAIQVYSDGAVLLESQIARTTQSSDALSVMSGTDVVIRSGTITTAGNGGRGIVVNTPAAPINITSGTITTTGANATAMLITPGSGATTINSGTISATGANSVGISVIGTGAIDVTSGTLTTGTGTGILAQGGNTRIVSTNLTGANSGIVVNSTGSMVINSGTIALNGAATAAPIGAITATGTSIAINSGTITNTGVGSRYGIDARVSAGAGNVAIDTGSITTTGNGAYGVLGMTNAGNVTINSTGTITTSGTTAIVGGQPRQANGIWAVSANGPISVTSNNVTTSGANAAGIAVEAGSGITSFTAVVNPAIAPAPVTVVSNGAIRTSGANAAGINVQAGGSATTIRNNGAIGTTGVNSYGINVAGSTGSTQVTSNGVTTSGAGATGIRTNGTTGAQNVSATSVATSGANAFGVDARSTTGAITLQTGTVSTSGVGSQGVWAQTTDGNISINAGTTTTTATGFDAGTGGTQDAVFGYSAGAGAVTVVSQNASTAGDYSTAVGAVGGGAVNITSGNASTTGIQTATVYGVSRNSNVTINAASTTAAGQNAYAVEGHAANGNLTMNVGTARAAFGNAVFGDAGNLVAVTANSANGSGNGGSGVSVTGGRGVTLTIGSASSTGTTVTSGAVVTRADAIYTTATTGTITANIGSASTLGANADGVRLVATGTGGAITAAIGGNVATAGANANGVFADAATGVSLTSAGSVRTTGANSTAINALSQTGAVNVTTAAVSTTGAGSSAIVARSVSGPATVAINGAVTSTGGTNAILVTGGTTAALTLGTGGSLTAAGRGALLTSVTGSTVTNAGTISGDGVTPILVATGGALTFNNSGSFTGLIGFTAGNDTVNNSGTYRALYSQAFGAGTDVFNNTGTLAVLSGTTVAGTVNFTGLEALNNSALIDLRNGHAGDTLSTSGTFTGTPGSVLGIDVALANAGTASVSDRLVAGGAITGVTTLAITRVDSNGAILNPGTIFAVGGAGSTAGAFVLTPTPDQGFVRYALAFTPATNSYSLIGGPSNAVFRTLKVTEGAQQLWHKSADAVAAQLSTARNVTEEASGARIWTQFFGQVNTRNTTQEGAAFGQTRTVDLSYKQDAFGMQAGVDLGSGGTVAFGVTGGYLNSVLNFANSADRINYSVANAGVYAQFSAGGFFLNALGKYDRSWIRSRDVTAGYNRRLNGNTYGARGEIGFHLGSAGFYAEPVASIAFVRTDIKDMRVFNATVDFDKLDGLRGKAGLRLGGDFGIGGDAKMQVYAQGNYVHEFEGEQGIALTSGGTTLRYGNRPFADYAEAKVGFSIASPGGVTGFVEGFGDFSKGYKGGGGRAGIRVGF